MMQSGSGMETFKQYVKNNPGILSEQDEVYISRANYNWGIVDIGHVNVMEIHEVYDLIEKRFYNKQPLPFEHFGGAAEGHYMFKDMISAHGKQIDLAPMFQDLEKRRDYVAFLVEYPNEYHIKNGILIICDKYVYENMSNEEREIYICMNAYINLVQRKCKVYSMGKKCEPLVGEVLNWVWFRKGAYKVSMKQMDRVKSWVVLNPELTFVLWTDMTGPEEMKEFLADIKEVDEEMYAWFFNGRVQVMYKDDTVAFVRDYFRIHANDRAIKLFDKERFTSIIDERDNGNIMIAKTDYLRAMILHQNGGFYADFNDCQCVVPLRFWMRELYKRQELIWPCDSMNPKQISNYFIYVPKGSKTFEKYHYNTLPGFKGLWTLMKEPSSREKLAKMYVDMCKKYVKKLKASESDQPIKLLVETIMPVYSSGKYLGDIEEVMGKQVLKGIEYCDPRGRCFLPAFCFEWIGKESGDRMVADFYKYLCGEMSQVGSIQPKRNQDMSMNSDGKMNKPKPQSRNERGSEKFDVVYLRRGYYEEYDDIEDLVPKLDMVLEELDKIVMDKDFQDFIYKKHMSNMCIAVVALTNVMLQNDANLTLNDVVPFSFAFMSFCYLTLVVHWGEGTSIGGKEVEV
jgi:hypothetical protein